MNTGDWIQLFLASIAAVGSIFAFWNIRVSNKAIVLQQKQWEHAAVPVYRIDFIGNASHPDSGKGVFCRLKNTNEVAHQVELITFTTSDIEIEFLHNGTTKSESYSRGELVIEKSYGMSLNLTTKKDDYVCGHLQLRGKDSLGNEFRLNSQLMEFSDYQLENFTILSQTYFYKV